ncbi:hypothetical protein CBL_11610 [Carabus blaptoides fortunei]
MSPRASSGTENIYMKEKGTGKSNEKARSTEENTKQMRVKLSSLAQACNRTGVSDRSAATIASAVLKDIAKKLQYSHRRPNNHLVMCRPLPKPCPAPILKTTEHIERQLSQELLHKEIFNNNMATVEVTVRTVGPQKGPQLKSLSAEKRESWGKLLAKQNSDESVIGPFSTFDPLRTLHFLSQELQLKLNTLCPGDATIHKIVGDMQSAMQRLPPDVVTQIKPSDENCFRVPSYKNLNKDQEKEMKKSQQTQTAIIGDNESKMLKHQLEESASKLEAGCKQMETACSKLQKEKDEIENQLLSEKETVKSLKKELEDRVSEKEEKLIQVNQTIITERNNLQSRIKQLESQLESHTGPTIQNLRTVIEELRDKQLKTEQENTSIRNKLTIMKLESDKYNVLLECKDKQIKELLEELENIQQLVSTQLDEYKCKPFPSPGSSISSISQISNIPIHKSCKRESVHEIFRNYEGVNNIAARYNKHLQTTDYDLFSYNKCSTNGASNNKLEIDTPHNAQNEAQEALSTATLSVEQKYSPKESHTSIKDLFAEIKRQAFVNLDVTLPSPPRPFVNVSPTESRTNDST